MQWLTLIVVAQAAAAPVAPQTPDPGESRWITVGEALTRSQGRASVEYRLFSAPDLAEMCAQPQPVALAGPDEPVVVVAGEPFPLGVLQVAALDARGARLDGVPLTITVEQGDPPQLDRQAVQDQPGMLTPLSPGWLRFRIQAICGDEPAWLDLEATVIPGAVP